MPAVWRRWDVPGVGAAPSDDTMRAIVFCLAATPSRARVQGTLSKRCSAGPLSNCAKAGEAGSLRFRCRGRKCLNQFPSEARHPPFKGLLALEKHRMRPILCFMKILTVAQAQTRFAELCEEALAGEVIRLRLANGAL